MPHTSMSRVRDPSFIRDPANRYPRHWRQTSCAQNSCLPAKVPTLSSTTGYTSVVASKLMMAADRADWPMTTGATRPTAIFTEVEPHAPNMHKRITASLRLWRHGGRGCVVHAHSNVAAWSTTIISYSRSSKLTATNPTPRAYRFRSCSHKSKINATTATTRAGSTLLSACVCCRPDRERMDNIGSMANIIIAVAYRESSVSTLLIADMRRQRRTALEPTPYSL